MSEFEIKLHIPDASLQAVQEAVARGDAKAVHLRARYFDTPDQRLAAARIALRVRQEGRHWVQTVKAAGDGMLHRLEEEVALVPDEPPTPVIRRHAKTPAGRRLAEVMGGSNSRQDGELVEQYRTDVRRNLRVVTAGTTSIELALDVGRISAGRRHARVQELELELKSGSRAAVIELAQQWCERHGLWLDTISKAERGHWLATGAAAAPPTGFHPPALHRGMDSAAMTRAVVASALDQVLGNASQVGGGCYDAEHVHQLRVGLRRLRTAAAEFGRIESFVGDAGLEVLAQAFRALGMHRDLTLIQPRLIALMRAEGAPALGVGEVSVPDPAAVVQAPALQAVLLGILGWQAGDAPAACDAEATRHALERRLRKLQRRVVAEGVRFPTLPPEQQHGLRKRFKRLRYLVEFASSLYPQRAVKRFVGELKPVQDALGTFQDTRMAAAFWSERTTHDAHAWYAVGWLNAREAAARADCEAALQRYAKHAEPFWTR